MHFAQIQTVLHSIQLQDGFEEVRISNGNWVLKGGVPRPHTENVFTFVDDKNLSVAASVLVIVG
jgi:hypothetical protein